MTLRKIPDSYPGLPTRYSERKFFDDFTVPPAKHRGSATNNVTTTATHTVSNSLFSNLHVGLQYTALDTDSTIKYTVNQ
jgi:hypothetical protein